MACDNMILPDCLTFDFKGLRGAAQTQKGRQAMKRLLMALLVAMAVVLILASNAR